MFQFQLNAIKEKPLLLPPPSLPLPHDSLFTLLVVIWPYEINRPSSLPLRPHREEGEEEEERGCETTTCAPGPTITLGRLHPHSFLKFILLLFVYFSIGKGMMMQGEKALKDPAPTTGRGSWAKLIQRPWALEEGAATPPGPRGAGSPHRSSSLCSREPWKREPGNASDSLRHKDHFKYSLYQQISS